jgi:hypothetical protein
MCLKIGFKVLYRSGKLKILNELDGIPRPRQKGSVRSLTCVKILSALLQKKKQQCRQNRVAFFS